MTSNWQFEMKKIVFVEKDDGSTYDPVTNFFAKKSQSAAKPKIQDKNKVINSQQKANNVLRKNQVAGIPNKNPATKNLTRNPNLESAALFRDGTDLNNGEKSEKMVTGKIGHKGEHVAPQREPLRKQESIYKTQQKGNCGQTNANINSKKLMTAGNKVQKTEQKIHNSSQGEEDNAGEWIENCDMLPRISPPNKNSNNMQEKARPSQQPVQNVKYNQEISALKNRIKELESAQNEYMQRLQLLQQKQQKFYKNEQKLIKLEKEHRLCSSQIRELSRRVQEKEEQMKKLLKKDDIPYNKKRQVMLANQMWQLKKSNRQLTARIKNYRGTDLVEISVQNNKADVLNEYSHGQSKQSQMNYIKIQQLLHNVVSKIDHYTNSKIGAANSTEDKRLLLDLQELSKQASLQAIAAEGQEYRMPKSNQECDQINIYHEIEEFKHKLEPVINKYDLNFVISEHNIQLINNIQENNCELISFKQSTLGTNCEGNQGLAYNKSGDKNRKLQSQTQKYRSMLQNLQKNSSYQQIIIAHCIAQLAYLKQFVNKQLVKFKDSIRDGIQVRLKELQELCEVGQSTKQSLFVYVSENIHEMLTVLPSIELRMKDIGQIFGKKTKTFK